MLGFDREAIESEWIFSQNFRHCRFFKRSRTICESGTLNLKRSQTGSSSCQCSTASIGHRKETMVFVFSNSGEVKEYARHWTFLGLGDEKKWYGTLPCTLEGKWDSTATQMVERFQDTGHPVFKSSSALSRGLLKKKNGRDTIHFKADASNTELLFRIIQSVNQLNIYGAVSDWCEQFSLDRGRKGTSCESGNDIKKALYLYALPKKTGIPTSA